jgi:serine/threonine-protein phosphatase 2A regulatory subunit A
MDSSQYVRAALASVVMELAPVMGKQHTIDHLVPVFLTLLKDQYPDVRLNVISKLDQVNQVRKTSGQTAGGHAMLRCNHADLAAALFDWLTYALVLLQVIGIELLAQSLLPAIEELAEDKHWRVRLAIVEHIPLLASQLGAEFFQDKLGPQCMKSLEDQVGVDAVMTQVGADVEDGIGSLIDCSSVCSGQPYSTCGCAGCLVSLLSDVWCHVCICISLLQVASIREAAAKTLQKIAQDFGPEWAKEHLVPAVLGMIKNPHYLYRMTMLYTISLLATIVHHDVLVGQMLPVILNASKDKVSAGEHLGHPSVDWETKRSFACQAHGLFLLSHPAGCQHPCPQVPNVKFNVAKMLEKVVPLLERSVIQQSVKPTLSELCEDGDMDVRFYARQALLACD